MCAEQVVLWHGVIARTTATLFSICLAVRLCLSNPKSITIADTVGQNASSDTIRQATI